MGVPLGLGRLYVCVLDAERLGGGVVVLLALIKVFVSVATWFVKLFPSGTPHLSVIESALSDMGFLRLVVPFGTLGAVIGIGVGIVAVVYIIRAVVWAWLLVKW